MAGVRGRQCDLGEYKRFHLAGCHQSAASSGKSIRTVLSNQHTCASETPFAICLCMAPVQPTGNCANQCHHCVKPSAYASRKSNRSSNLLLVGLEFGVALILPSIPFVAQYEMLRLLSKRSIKVIFTSQSMSMGVNYPVRSAIIRAPTGNDIDVMMYMQMSGRAGRRRLDDRAFVVAWNVHNAATANLSTFPRIVLPAEGATRGVLIADAQKVATQIDASLADLTAGSDAMAVALGLLSSTRSGAGAAGAHKKADKQKLKTAPTTRMTSFVIPRKAVRKLKLADAAKKQADAKSMNSVGTEQRDQPPMTKDTGSNGRD